MWSYWWEVIKFCLYCVDVCICVYLCTCVCVCGVWVCGCGCVGLFTKWQQWCWWSTTVQLQRWNRRQDQLRTLDHHHFPLTWLCVVQNQHNNYNTTTTTTTDNNNKMLDDMNSLWVHILEYTSMFLLNKGTHQHKVWTRAGQNRPILVHEQCHFQIHIGDLAATLE